jgi:hypothetical protein
MGMNQHIGLGMASCSAMSSGSDPRPPAGAVDRPTFLLVALGIVMVAALGAAALLFLGGGDDSNGGGGGGLLAPSTAAASVNVEFQPTQVVSHNGGPPAQLSQDQVDAIMQTAGSYFDLGVIDPLTSGKPAGDVSALFDAAAGAQINSLARLALFEEGLPAATGGLDAKASSVTINGLSDGTGTFVLATVGSDVNIVAKTDDGELQIHRITELTLVPEGATWKIAGYDVIVDRQGPGVKKPTVTASSTP